MPVEIKQQKSEVDEMLASRGNPSVEKEESTKKAEEQETGAPEVEKTEAPTPPDNTDKDERDEVIERLTQENASLKTTKSLEDSEPEKPKAKEEEEPELPPKEIEAFMTADEFAEMQTNPEKANEIMFRVYKRARQDASEDVIRQIPNIVQAASARQLTLQQSVQEFYAKNPDLRKHAQYVGFKANQIKSKQPELSVQEILEEAEKQVREDLSLAKTAEETEEARQEGLPKNKQPAFAHRGSGNHKGGSVDSRNSFQKQADAMIESLR